MISGEDMTVVLELNNAQAIVLFEFLSRFSDKDVLEIEDDAEAKVLLGICCDLESALVEPLMEDYRIILQKAREKVRDPKE